MRVVGDDQPGQATTWPRTRLVRIVVDVGHRIGDLHRRTRGLLEGILDRSVYRTLGAVLSGSSCFGIFVAEVLEASGTLPSIQQQFRMIDNKRPMFVLVLCASRKIACAT